MSSLVQSPVVLPANAVAIVDDHAVTTSLKIAEIFGRNHKDVLRAIRDLSDAAPADFHGRNFAPMSREVTIGNGAVRTEQCYHITRDGFVLLVMGFTGRLATAFKIAYIERFNAMEQAIAPSTAAASLAASEVRVQAILDEAERRLSAAQRVRREAKRAWLSAPERDQELLRARAECQRLAGQLRAAHRLALEGDPELNAILHYSKKDLNAHEVHRLTDIAEARVAERLQRMAEAGIDTGPHDEVLDLVRNGLVALPPAGTEG